ncbi:cytochrome b/b6 domain-containing protein [Rahnella laticis]|uniref:cytochrome b/b6 domain-containing protein n=1 Tax=Rahnella laticis TaxID=2787622 RepID=UPI0018A28C30|nr:cytochrome b/b6 domain-containing protein [Rahnella laticis]MBF7993705.1 cytochrome b/b6 domain-containing protein [Rahnella laticis]
MENESPLPRVVHSIWLRISHWVNALAMLIMVTSGWRIYNASPLFNFDFPNEITLGGWLGGALQWHFAGMWLFGLNGLFYLLINLVSGRLKRKFFPLSVSGIIRDLTDALRGKLSHESLNHYNMVQKLAYLFVMIDSLIIVVSGLVVWKSVQFPILRFLTGGFDAARYIHFFAMSTLVAFVVIHLVMVALVPKTLLAMLRGR